MLLEINKVIHPNAIKHVAELLGEELLEPSVIKELIGTNFKDSPNGMKSLQDFLIARVNEKTAMELIKRVNEYIYSMDCIERIISDYANTKKVRRELKRKLDRENNNKNHTYDFEAILSDFKEKVLGPYSAYDFDSNGLFKSLIHSFNNFYCKDYSKFIYSVFNEKGSLVSTEEGNLLLESLASIEIDDRKFTINFSEVIKNIYEASKDLFNIGGEINYDLFTHYLNSELQNLDGSIKSLMHESFNIETLGPRIITDIKGFGSVPYRVKTLRKRVELLELFQLNVRNGLDLDSLQSLFKRVVESDSLITDTNVGKLFEHKETVSVINAGDKVKKSKYKKFLDILQGVVSLDTLVTYLHNIGKRLYEDDCVLFRDEAYYKRFNSLDDYLLIKDVTKDLIEESNTLDENGNPINKYDKVPFMTNDECFDYLLRGVQYNFASLRDYVNSNLQKNMNKFDISKSLTELKDLFTLFYNYYCCFDEAFNNLAQMLGPMDLAPSGDDEESRALRKQIFDGVVNAIPNGESAVQTMFFIFTPSLRTQALMENDITLLLRYLNFSVNVLYHIIKVLEQSESTLEFSLLTLDRDNMYLPSNVQNLEDVSKFKTYVPMKFYLTGDRTSNDVSLRKQYYLFYDDIKRGIAPAFNYLQEWKKSIEKKAESLGVTFSKGVLSNRLRELSILINGKEDNSSEGLRLFSKGYQVIEGFLFINGSIYKHPKGYIHVRGYFVDPRLEYMITPIPSNLNLNSFER